MKKDGSTKALCAALKNLPREFDPGGAVTTVQVRLSLMNRDYAEAARWLETSSRDSLNDAGLGGMAASIDGYSFPRMWYEGLIARGQGNENAAKGAFAKARETVQADLRQWPDDAKTNIMLALVDAALGRREDALKKGRRAVELLPISMDAFDGPAVATNLAVVYAQVGQRELALDQLTPLLEIPNGPTRGMLRVEPEWDPLRGDARFEK